MSDSGSDDGFDGQRPCFWTLRHMGKPECPRGPSCDFSMTHPFYQDEFADFDAKYGHWRKHVAFVKWVEAREK